MVRRNPETEVTELVLYITNDGDLYRRQTQPIIANLAKKKRKGVYDATKALKLWKILADAGAQKYNREFGGGGSTSHGIFSVADRKDAAKELADYYAEELADAAGTRSNPRHRRSTMARRKKSRRRSSTSRGGVRTVRFHTRGGKVKVVRFHKTGTKAAKRGSAKKKAHGRALARKYKLVWKGAKGHKRVFLRMPGGRLKKIKQPH